MKSKLLSPFWLPVWFFAAGIILGAVLLDLPISQAADGISGLDALFTATSAMCVTGLVVVDTGSAYTLFGQNVILALIQLGGLGIMTYTSLVVYLLGRKVSMADRVAVGQTLLHDPSFHLSRFMMRVLLGTLSLEAVGAVALFLLDPEGFHPYSAVFHSISAFCNAGFSLYSNSLMAWSTDWAVNMVFIVLITLGGIGFAVLGECASVGRRYLRKGPGAFQGRAHILSWHARIVLETSLFLVVGGTALIFFSEMTGGIRTGTWDEELLAALFQSVTCRTAGFNTVDLAAMNNLSLVIMLGLMFVGGSPGSCAGGVKTTTLRAMVGFVAAQLRGRSQVRVGWYALKEGTINRAVTLVTFALLLIALAILVLETSESGHRAHIYASGQFLETVFESISAFGTVGLSLGLTDDLAPFGQVVIIVLMFVGRLGPIWLLSALQSWQREPRYRVPQDDLPLG